MSERPSWLSKASHFCDVVGYRASAELRAEAKRTYAGFLWWILLPIFSLAIYYVAFQYILDRGGEGFAMFLFSGIVFWQWFQMSVVRCSSSLIVSRGLMQQVSLHKTVFPTSIVLVNLFKFSITFTLLLVVVLLAGHSPTVAWFSLVPLLALEFLLIVACGCAAASISPFFPDFQLMLETALQLMFFVSGIFFDLANLPPKLLAILRFNPVAVLIGQFRRVLLEGQWLQWEELLLPTVETAVVLVFSLGVLHRYDKVYAKLG